MSDTAPCLWLGRPPCPLCGRDHGDRKVPLGTDAELRAELAGHRKPRRIQRKRTRGWRMPAGAVYVGRPTKWGNPYRIGWPLVPGIGMPGMTGEEVLHWYERHLDLEIAAGRLDLEELRGKDLACWCPLGAPCHGDVLIRRANA